MTHVPAAVRIFVSLAGLCLLSLPISSNRPDTLGRAGQIEFEKYSKRKDTYHGGVAHWCLIEVNGARYTPPKYFFNPRSENERLFQGCEAGPDPKVSALAVKMYNDVVGLSGWHILRLAQDKPVLNFVSLSELRWSSDGQSVLFSVPEAKGQDRECRLNVVSGETTPVVPTEAACTLPLADDPKYVTYRDLDDALSHSEDVHILDLSHQKFTRLSPRIGELVNLERLSLEFVLNLELPAELWQLAKLRELNLRNTFVRDIPPEVGNLKQLKKLDLGGTKLSPEQKNIIAALLPNCEIQ